MIRSKRPKQSQIQLCNLTERITDFYLCGLSQNPGIYTLYILIVFDIDYFWYGLINRIEIDGDPLNSLKMGELDNACREGR